MPLLLNFFPAPFLLFGHCESGCHDLLLGGPGLGVSGRLLSTLTVFETTFTLLMTPFTTSPGPQSAIPMQVTFSGGWPGLVRPLVEDVSVLFAFPCLLYVPGKQEV